MGNEQGRLQAGMPTPAGIQSMDESLQKKFAKGIQYNMKILLRGDRNTGKSCLFQRMQGKPFSEAYTPTNEIQVSSILWSYRGMVTSDTVKVEVWDVVDRGKVQKKKGKPLLKMFNEPGQEESDQMAPGGGVPLDAAFMDVYKGAHGVVFVFDITKQWTWKYVEKELPRVPLHIPVMLLANFRDMGEHRLMTRDECVYFVGSLERPEGAADVRYAESSMKNGFGLMHLHKFLSIPFLQLQQETLLQQLQVNREQTLASSEELNSAILSEDQDYDKFLNKLERISAEKILKKAQAAAAAQEENENNPTSPHRRDTLERGGVSQTDSGPAPTPGRQQPSKGAGSSQSTTPQRSSSFSSKLTSKFSKLMSRNSKEDMKPDPPASPDKAKAVSASRVEDFVPEGELDAHFLAGEEEEEDSDEEEDESDEDGANPLIARDDDLSSPEEREELVTAATSMHHRIPSPKQPAKPLKAAKDIVLTESESEEEEEEEVGEPAHNHSDDAPPAPIAVKPKAEVSLDELFAVPPVKQAATHKKQAKSSGGLMLEFATTSTPEKAKDSSSAAKKGSSSETKKSKKDKHHKKSRKEKKTAEVAVESGGKVEVKAAPSSEDPFGAIAALDAWLNSDATSADEVVKPPVKPAAAPSGGGGTEKGEEEGEEEEEEKPSKISKHKKHRHGNNEEERGERRKKHRHKSKRSHHHEQAAPEDYEAL